MRKLATALMITVLICGFFFVTLTVSGENSANIISSDTTWAISNSPYTLASSVIVASGATLTIQPGVTVNINQGASLQVEGTLIAVGTNADNIQLSGSGDIVITQSVSSGTAIQDAVVNVRYLELCNSCKIDNDTIDGNIYLFGGSPRIIDSNIVGEISGNESSQAPVISNNNVVGQIGVEAGSPTIENNVVAGISPGYQTVNGSSYAPSLCIAIFAGPAEAAWPLNAVIIDNTVTCGLDGIDAGEGGSTTAIIQNNLVENCTRDAMAISSTATIENNTLINNNIGIYIFNFWSSSSFPSPTLPKVMGNNIFNSSQYNIYYESNMNLIATYNWWGTTNLQAISQTIYDHAFDPTLGTVSISPCLTAPNPQAYPNTSNLIAYPSVSPSPAQSSGSGNSTQPTQITSTTYFSIESNSTVSNLFFNSTDQELGFTVRGPPGTIGFAKITIAKTLMPTGNLQVYIDGNLVNSSVDSNESYWIVTFTYHHSTHQVIIKSSTQASGNGAFILNETEILILAGTLTALGVFGFLLVYSLRDKSSKRST
jgi:hypothetical protein